MSGKVRTWAIVDFNGVLGRQPDAGHWARLAVASGWVGTVASLQAAFWRQRPGFDAEQVSGRDFWESLIGPRRPVQHLVDMDADMWLHIDDQVLRVLRAAVGAGVRLAMLSNAPVPVAQRISAASWAGVFEKVVFSCDIGVNKPEFEAYRAALRAIGDPDPGTVLMVDDREENVDAATRLGLRGHQFVEHEGLAQVLADYTGWTAPIGARSA